MTRALVGLGIVVAVAACGSATTKPAAVPDAPLAQQLSTAVSTAAAMTHLQALQEIADENGGNRAAGTRGYEASVEYVAAVLRGAGFAATTPAYASDDEEGASVRGRNVVAQTRTGDPGRTVVIGAHLDSVPEGPGIVDNGSGVATLLEIATRLGADPAVANSVRFAFFGGEEDGAVGSTAYVQSLSTDDREKIKLYLNVDMVASPNAGYLVQGGVGDDEEAAGPAGSATVARALADQLSASGATAPEVVEFVGDDESAFVEAGIPAGGAENGDAKRKTAQQAQRWGGQAGQEYDRCYHQACDRIDNVNQEVLGHYLKAIAGTLANLAASTDGLG